MNYELRYAKEKVIRDCSSRNKAILTMYCFPPNFPFPTLPLCVKSIKNIFLKKKMPTFSHMRSQSFNRECNQLLVLHSWSFHFHLIKCEVGKSNRLSSIWMLNGCGGHYEKQLIAQWDTAYENKGIITHRYTSQGT